VIVLGIDPGLAGTGYGVVRRLGGSGRAVPGGGGSLRARRADRLAALDGGVIATAADLAPELRLTHIHEAVIALLHEHRPDAVALEEVYFGQNARSAFAVGQARGVAMLAAGRSGIRCAGYTPQQVKGAVCGSGRADKEQVARMVAALLGLGPASLPDHATDALAVAICHLNTAPLARALAGALP
jgi:crossover junction endodeoxyribonuclease RuvC